MSMSRLDRRTLLRGAAVGGGLLGLQGLLPAWAQTGAAGLRADAADADGAGRGPDGRPFARSPSAAAPAMR